MNNKEYNEAIRLIDRLYRDLYKSDIVLHGNKNEFQKFDNIKSYIERLEKVHKKVIGNQKYINMLKKYYYDKYVIKKEDIPDEYYELQKKIDLERGYGHIELSDSKKSELADILINDQKRSLDNWLDYFLSDDSNYIPTWAKFWAFQGMLRLGKFDKEKGIFNKRTKNTTSIFADLNRETLALSIDFLRKVLNKETIDDKELEKIVKSGSFKKIYEHILNTILNNNKDIIKRDEGIWIKYDKGSDHMPLVKSLKEYNTGWCTAGEETAKSQLKKGDFYVYYTLDNNNEYKVPRIAIRMEGNSIGEIRGVADKQNIESNMEKVLDEKLKEFPDRDKYYKKVNDMQLLTYIYEKNKNNIELSKEDLNFLYEIDNQIEGFGYQKDPRIEEIIEKRNKKSDLAHIFDCREDQIALSKEELKEDTFYLCGNLEFLKESYPGGLKLPRIITGSLDLSRLKSAEGIELPSKIGKNLYLHSLESTEGLELPTEVGSLYLRRLKSGEGLKLPHKVGKNLCLSSLKSAEGLELPTEVVGDLELESLESAEGLKLPTEVGGTLDLRSLKNAEGLKFPTKVGIDLYLSSLKSVKDLKLPTEVGEFLDLVSLESAEGIEFPHQVGSLLRLCSLKRAVGLKFPQIVGGSLDLRSLESAEDLEFPKKIGKNLWLSSLESAQGLKLPEQVGDYVNFKGLKSLDGLNNPNNLKLELPDRLLASYNEMKKR